MGRRPRRNPHARCTPAQASTRGRQAGLLLVFLVAAWQTAQPTLCPGNLPRDMRVASDAGEPDPLPPVPQALWTDMHMDASSIPAGAGRILPLRPFQGQRTPPCPPGAREINGGCWDGTDVTPPCPPPRHFEWSGKCYLPVALVEKTPVGETP